MSGRSIATRKGDDGSTSLLYGQRVPKNHLQIEAVGACDELNAALGLARATCPEANRKAGLKRIQQDLVALMGELACAEADARRHAGSKFRRLGGAALKRVDAALAIIEAKNLSFENWATPGANLHAAALDVARTAARRVERHLVGLPAAGRTVRPVLLQYVNRISDLLWLMARDAESHKKTVQTKFKA